MSIDNGDINGNIQICSQLPICVFLRIKKKNVASLKKTKQVDGERKKKAREESWGPPRESRPSEEREWDREKERERENQDRDENDKDPEKERDRERERERDRERDGDREDRFRRPRFDALIGTLCGITVRILILSGVFPKVLRNGMPHSSTECPLLTKLRK